MMPPPSLRADDDARPFFPLCIVIVNWNTRALLQACLESIYATVETTPFQVIVVDNASTDGSAQFVRTQYPKVDLISNSENVGFARANNQALARANAEFILLLNSDAQLLPGTADELVRFLRQETNAAAVAPRLMNPNRTFQAGPNDAISLTSELLLAFGIARLLRDGYFPGYGPDAPRREYAWVGGTCMLLRRKTIEQIGTLDPDYFMYTEEADWCYRAHQASWEIWYEPTLAVIHHGGASSRNDAGRMRAELYKSKLVFFSKHRPRWEYETLRAVLMLTALVKSGAYNLAARLSEQRAQFYAERASSFLQVFQMARLGAA